MNTACKVSLYCTAYNHENYIRQALDSFLAQKTDFPFEVLVTDDASTDSTPAILREYGEKYPEIIRSASGRFSRFASRLLRLCPQHLVPLVRFRPAG